MSWDSGQRSGFEAIINALDLPLLLVFGHRIESANAAARALLGDHIVEQDARLALRHPAAVELLAGRIEGPVVVTGLSGATSVWDVAATELQPGLRLVELRDRSAQSDVSRAHTDFVANASHELRTPLAAILGYVETLMEPKAGSDAPTRERFLGIVKREAARLQRLVEDLMSLSRIEAERHDAPQSLVNLSQLVQSIVNEIEAAGDVASPLAAEVSDRHMTLLGDAGQLTQLVRNLIDNAVKYGGAGNLVSVRIDENLHGHILLSVVDEGEGIAPEHIPRLTERFYRVDPARSRSAGGTGLGLAIVKHIVQRHRGQLDIRSEQGVGTTVTVSFPRA
jgi:two-component system, OmpR family, phosphate regulon sensor histidine kinase PhoR